MTTTLQQLQDDLAQISASAHPTTGIYFDGAPREVTARFSCGRIILDIEGAAFEDELAGLRKRLEQADEEASDAQEEADDWESRCDDRDRAIQRIVEASEANDPAKLTAAIEAAKKLIE
jgi:hypothetical protein